MELQIGLPFTFIRLGRNTIFIYANGVNITNNISNKQHKDRLYYLD